MNDLNLHPLVAEYVTSDLTLDALSKKHKRSADPLVQAFVDTIIAINDNKLRLQTLDRLARVPLDGAPPDMAVFLMTFWAHLSNNAGRLLESKALLHRAKALVNARTHPAVEALVIFMEFNLAGRGGYHSRAEELIKQLLRLFPLDLPRRKTWVAVHCGGLYVQGKGASAEAKAHELYLQRNLTENFTPGFLASLKAIDYLERCKPDDALAQLEIWERAPIAPVIQQRLKIDWTWLNLLRNQWHPALKPPASGSADPDIPAWLMALYALQQRQPQLSLQWARVFARQDIQTLNGLGAEAFTLIRAELACRNIEGASRLLQLRNKRGTQHYLDDFFYARLYALKGEFGPAARHFASVWRSARKYEAEARLNFELSLACELSPLDLARLAHEGKEAAPAPAVALPGSKTQTPPKAANGMIGKSKMLASIRETIRHFATLAQPVLITGETGTGKEMVARALHEGKRAKHPYIAVNCGAIAESLLESELFGHARGAFTGAERARAGIFTEAGQGTLFLDEIGEISPRLQVSLLRVLENNEVRPVGGNRPHKIECRVVFATNVDLDQAVREGTFRKDLLYRLRRLEIHIPALRERREDILPLADHFLNLERAGAERATLAPELERLLLNYAWPGNVRELRNEIERFRLLNSDKAVYSMDDLAAGLKEKFSAATPVAKNPNSATPAQQDQTPPAGQPSATPEMVEYDDARRFLGASKLQFRRIKRLKDLFVQHETLTRREVSHLMKIASLTAARDLKALEAEKFITRVMPTRSAATHYFKLNQPTPAN